MNHVKMCGLVVTVAGLIALVGTSSAFATTLTGSGGSTLGVGTKLHAKNEGGKIVLDAIIGNIECNSTIEVEVTNAGSSTTTVSGPIINNLAVIQPFVECNASVSTLAKGSLEIHTQEVNANNNGTLTSSGLEFTVEFRNFHCVFRTGGTDLGTVTGSATTGGKATIDIQATIPRTGGRSGVFCGENAPLTGSYLVESPMILNVD